MKQGLLAIDPGVRQRAPRAVRSVRVRTPGRIGQRDGGGPGLLSTGVGLLAIDPRVRPRAPRSVERVAAASTPLHAGPRDDGAAGHGLRAIGAGLLAACGLLGFASAFAMVSSTEADTGAISTAAEQLFPTFLPPTPQPSVPPPQAPAEPAKSPSSPAAPRFVWVAEPGADRYRVALFRDGGEQIFERESVGTALQLPASWTYDGRPQRLNRGTYRWVVWPLFEAGGSVRVGLPIVDARYKV